MTRATAHIPQTRPIADPAQVVSGPNWRITVLTPRLLRLEWSDDGVFEDRPTQVVWNRALPPVPFQVTRSGDGLRLTTEALQLDYDGARFSAGGLTVRQLVGAQNHSQWHYGLDLPVQPREPAWLQGNLGGTARTLDEADGAVPLEPGLLATRGSTTLDDSGSLALDADGWPTPRVGDIDLYLFGHGHDAQGALDDFYAITGPTPLLPRWALGNWWSRYHEYSAEEYLALMDRFAAENLPFSVAVVNMDWHWVNLEPGLGSGWTGFSFNTDLFPDPDAFLAALHERGLTVSLNLHPADGIRRHEDAYPRLAKRLGLDPATGEAIAFAVEDPEFIRAYLEEVLHPLEEAGVDFWWLDWQQGGASGMPGLDPLWLLNHVHFLDSARTGRRPLTFSRYAGPGSHRYPVGFSGDTITTWESLHFQPYFTATASNIGYGWWSHDLGGHMMGERDDEMVARWLQLGVWSPIMRLHSSASPFTGKEPWNFGARAAAVMADSLRLRHRLLPYLYTMNERAHAAGVPLVRPLYWEDQRAETVLTSTGTFLFGSELLIAPLTTPADRRTGCARVRTWLPAGTWTDWYSGLRYTGGRFVEFGRPLETYPVLARAGAIVPLTAGDDLGVGNPAALQVRVFAGADGSFELYEDDDAAEPVTARTPLRWEQASGTFTIAPVIGDAAVLPAERRWTVAITGVAPAQAPGVESSYDEETGTLTLDLGVVDPAQGRVVRFAEAPRPSDQRLEARVFALLHQLQVRYDDKHVLWDMLTRTPSPAGRLAALAALPVADDVKNAITELLIAEV
ncbi:MAG: glycoside hydrolase family 31 protein [Propioniciclava sp.]|uniref:glycoside hydrolase family 31 protein n=1 Tax=Propioniciclava sp. TaxID=2038686 RepID=UPI0039E57171